MEPLDSVKPESRERSNTKVLSEMQSTSSGDGPDIKKAIEFGKSNRPHRLPAPTQKTKHRLARPGENVCENGVKASLYHPWYNGLKHLDEFGIGVSLYFRQLLFVALILTLCVGIYAYTIMNNATEVNVAKPDIDTPLMLRGSVYGTVRDDLTLVSYGYADMAVVALLLFCLAVAKKTQDVTVKSIDESQQTSQDYTVRIMHPPSSIVDPDVYYNQFKEYGDVVFITICLDNGALMKKVTEKYELEHRLQASLASSRNTFDDPHLTDVLQISLPWWKRFLQKFGLFETRESLQRKLRKVKAELHGLAQRPYAPVRIYITFDTEEAQRKCLRACSGGAFNRGSEENMVAGQRVKIKEAEEPSTVIWVNLHYSRILRILRLIVSLSISAGVLAASFVVIKSLFGLKTVATAIFIALVNAALPFIMKVITWSVEMHTSVASLQGSIMIKLVIARSINSALLLYIASPFDEIFGKDTLSQVMIILLVDAFITPALRLFNLYDNAMKRIIAPRQPTQAGMDRFFLGADWNMAERYTDMLKTMFVGLFYSAILPTGLIPTVIAMITAYWVDKYCLFRIWKKSPAFDATLAGHSRLYMIGIAWVHVMITRVFYANWPFEVNGAKSDCNFAFCSAPEIGEWTKDQEILVHIYEWVGLFLFAVGLSIFGVYYLQNYTRNRSLCGFSSGQDHSGRGDAAPVSFRSVPGIDCYVPQVKSVWLVEPLFGLDLTRLPINAQQYLPVRSGGIYTAAELSMNTLSNFPKLSSRERAQMFSKIKYYPAEGEELESAVPTLAAAGAQDSVSSLQTGDTNLKSPIGRKDVFQLESLQEVSDTHNDLVKQNKEALAKPPVIENTFSRGIMIPVNGKMVIPASGPMLPNGQFPVTVVGPPTPAFRAQELVRDQIPVPVNPEDRLPEGWSERLTSDGRTFYANDKKQYTQWERPAAPAMQVPTPKAAQLRDDEVDWYLENVHYEVKVDAEGRTYYEDHVKRITTWERPSGPIRL